MVVDVIEHEFVGSVRPYYDRPDISVPVQWYRAPAGAVQMPHVTAFANRIDKVESFVPLVGINYDFQPNNVGNVFGNLGIAPCGDASAWLNGVSFDNPPPPCQCRRERVIPVEEVPVGIINGANRTFTLSQIPMSAQSLLLFLDGVAMTQGVDYSIAAATIRFAAASTPRTGDSLLAYYWVQP